jgi:8-oxo-dGDP phosphatase
MKQNRKPGDPAPWETLTSVYLHRKPWMTMRMDSVRLANGRVIEDYYIQEFPPWVNVLALTPERKAVLIRQYRHGIADVHYELPAGVHDHPGESILQAAQRELLEETGFSGGSWSLWMELSANPSLQNNISYTFLAEGVLPSGPQQLDETEEISVHTVTVGTLMDIVLDGRMIQSLHVAPVLKYLMQRHAV